MKAPAVILFCTFICACGTSNVTAWSWTRSPSNANTVAPKVSGHAAATAEDRILLFGGLTGSAGSSTTEDLWMYAENEWTMIPKRTQGISRPGRRMYAASSVLNGSFYLFGGWDPGEPGSGGTFLDDVWRLSLKSMKWDRCAVTLPYAVSRHCACTIGPDAIVVLTHKGLLLFAFDGRNWSISEQPTKGEGPDGLSMCGSASLGDGSGRVLIFGGSTREQKLSSEAYVLDTQTWTWTKLKRKVGGDGGLPPPIASPSCAALAGGAECIVFGGATLGSDGYAGGLIPQDATWLCTIEDDSVEWQRVASEGESPEGRVAASLSAFGDEFVLQGGWDPTSKETYDQTWFLTK